MKKCENLTPQIVERIHSDRSNVSIFWGEERLKSIRNWVVRVEDVEDSIHLQKSILEMFMGKSPTWVLLGVRSW